MRKRYQVFVSSTFEDLREERNALSAALLENDYIPAGMELFAASSDAQRNAIERVIDGCDYYVVVVAGRYGSLNQDGIGFTQWEYEYAVSRGIPVLAFLHDDPDSLSEDRREPSEEGRAKLAAFKRALGERLYHKWSNPKDLCQAVTTSLNHETRQYPREGWVRTRSWINFHDDDALAHFDWKQLSETGYYMTGFVCRIRFEGRRLTFAIHSRVIPVRGRPSIVPFGFDYGAAPSSWGKPRFLSDVWHLGEKRLVSPHKHPFREPVPIVDREWMLYTYTCEFTELPQVLTDDHKFGYYVDSLRIEATIPDSLTFEAFQGDKVLAKGFIPADHTGLATWVVDRPTGLEPDSRFRWQISFPPAV